MGHLVAVYGTLKRGEGNHHWLEEEAEYIGTTLTQEHYTMYDGGYPKVVEGVDYPITVEVFAVPDLEKLDQLEGHPNLFKRELVDVVGIEEKAWMYLYQYPVPQGNQMKIGVWNG
jgi:gamma-glutamylaminecyclotransferase